MQNAERQRLVSTMSDEPANVFANVLKCVVCLAFLVLLLVIGYFTDRDPVAQVPRNDALHSATAAGRSSAEVHRKEVFDERRAKFVGKAAGPMPSVRALAAEGDEVAR